MEASPRRQGSSAFITQEGAVPIWAPLTCLILRGPGWSLATLGPAADPNQSAKTPWPTAAVIRQRAPFLSPPAPPSPLGRASATSRERIP